MQQTEQSVLSRKLSGKRVGRAPIQGVEEIGENFAKILDEKLRGLLRTIVGAIVIDCEVRKLSRVLEDVAVPAMIGVISVANSKNSALINLNGDLIYHIVDLRMGGDPSEAPIPTARSITSVDTALCAAFVRATIEAFEGSLQLNLGPSVSRSMTLDHFEQHVTMVRIAPEHSDVLVLRLSLDIGEAARSGEFDLVLPLSVLDSYKAIGKSVAQPSEAVEQSDLWSSHMAHAASNAPVNLGTVLQRLKLSVSEIQALEPGSIIPLSEAGRNGVEITFEGDGTHCATGRLGTFEGRKAVKITEPPNPKLQEQIRKLADLGGTSH